MQLKCIRHFSQYEPGDLVEVPDGAAFDDFHWEPVASGDVDAKLSGLKEQLADLDSKKAVPVPPEPAAAPAAAAAQFPANPKEM